MSSNYDRVKQYPPYGYQASVPKIYQNKFFRDPAFSSWFNRGSVGASTNPTFYSSPYYAIRAKGSWRTCSTTPDERTDDSCIDNTY